MQDSSNRFTSRICAVSQWRGTDTAHHRAVEHTQRSDGTTTTSHRKEPHGPPRQRAAPPLFHTRASVGLSHSHAPTQLTRHDIVIHTQRRPARLTTCAHADVHSHAAAVAPAPPSPRRRALAPTPCTRADAVHSRRGARVDALGVTCSGFITPGARNPRAPGSSRVRHASSRSVERELGFALVHQAIVAPAREHFAMHEPP